MLEINISFFSELSIFSINSELISVPIFITSLSDKTIGLCKYLPKIASLGTNISFKPFSWSFLASKKFKLEPLLTIILFVDTSITSGDALFCL